MEIYVSTIRKKKVVGYKEPILDFIFANKKKCEGRVSLENVFEHSERVV